MIIRICLCFAALFVFTACAALSSQVSQEMAPQISTEVAVQVATAVVEQVATALVEGNTAEAVQSVSKPSDSQPEGEALVEYDCSPKYCKDMSSCDEAVYKLTVCGYGRLDANNDGVPCESLCTALAFAAVTVVTPALVPVEETAATGGAEIGRVTRVVDGDTIDVLLDGVNTRIRYLQMNTPERDQPCSRESTQANADLVAGQTVRLVPDKELVDPYDRLLRFVYVGDLLVNRELVAGGWAEVVLYPPNDARYDEFLRLEQEAAAAGRGCHPTGVFNDGSTTR